MFRLADENKFMFESGGHYAGCVIEGGVDGASPLDGLHSAKRDNPSGSEDPMKIGIEE